MGDFKLRIGLTDKSKRNIKNFPKEFQNALKPAFEKIMLKAESKSKQKYFKTGSLHSPPDSKIITTRTGNLQRSIQSEVKDNINKIEASLTADIEYAATHEYGDSGRNISPRSFLTPAIENVIEDAMFETIINNEIDKRTQWK